MKTLSKLTFLLLTFIIASCKFNSNEVFIIKEINIYDLPEENEKIGNDLISYDYSRMIVKDLKIENSDVLKNINWKYWVADGSKQVTFQLILKNEAKEYKEKLVPFFENFVNRKLSDYNDRKEHLEEVVKKANEFINLIKNENYDSLWKQVSPTFSQITNQEDFYKILENRKINFHPEGDRKIKNRQVYSEIGNGLKGEFYVINYEYLNKVYEQVTLQRIDNRIELLGYRYFYPQ